MIDSVYMMINGLPKVSLLNYVGLPNDLPLIS